MVHIQSRGAVTNLPHLKILFILDTDNNKALDCGLQSYFFYPTVFLTSLVAIYIQRVCNYTDEVQGPMALAFAYRHLSCVKVFW
jgi:hypothetical protein